jgi:hypothetical protein
MFFDAQTEIVVETPVAASRSKGELELRETFAVCNTHANMVKTDDDDVFYLF